MNDKINKVAVYNAFVNKKTDEYENMNSTTKPLEEAFEKPKEINDGSTAQLLNERVKELDICNRIKKEYERILEFNKEGTKEYPTVQEGALMIYNGSEDAKEKGIYFGPFTGMVEVEGIKISAMTWNSTRTQKFKGLKKGSTFTLPNGTYTVQKVL